MRAAKRIAWTAVLVFMATIATAQDAPPEPPKASVQSVTSALRALLPGGVTINELRREGEAYVFDGATATNALLSDFMRRTMAAPGFRDVDLREIAMNGKQYRYIMAIKVDCSAPGAGRQGAACGPAARPGAVHKCRINGTLTFQAAPCPAGTEAG